MHNTDGIFGLVMRRRKYSHASSLVIQVQDTAELIHALIEDQVALVEQYQEKQYLDELKELLDTAIAYLTESQPFFAETAKADFWRDKTKEFGRSVKHVTGCRNALLRQITDLYTKYLDTRISPPLFLPIEHGWLRDDDMDYATSMVQLRKGADLLLEDAEGDVHDYFCIWCGVETTRPNRDECRWNDEPEA